MWRSCLIPKPFPIPSSSRTLKWHLETLDADRFMTTPEQLFCNWKKKSPCSNSKLLSFFDFCVDCEKLENASQKRKKKGENSILFSVLEVSASWWRIPSHRQARRPCDVASDRSPRQHDPAPMAFRSGLPPPRVILSVFFPAPPRVGVCEQPAQLCLVKSSSINQLD